jgi:hypothetical protein
MAGQDRQGRWLEREDDEAPPAGSDAFLLKPGRPNELAQIVSSARKR